METTTPGVPEGAPFLFGGKLNGLDLFSGIGGISIALEPWVRPITYVEIDPYCQSVLVDRMLERRIPVAPIWSDVRTLGRADIAAHVDIICGGFPCQDISVAGRGAGLDGKRSGLFCEIMRLAEEFKPRFIFLENVPAIRTRGASRVVQELADLGYDCRWGVLSAFDVGAPHKRERWFLLAYGDGDGQQRLPKRDRQGPKSRRTLRHDPHGLRDDVPDANGINLRDVRGRSGGADGEGACEPRHHGAHGIVADAACGGRLAESTHAGRRGQGNRAQGQPSGFGFSSPFAGPGWWAIEPDVGRVAHGVPARVDRLRALGNAVVPAQAREAFRRLAGLPSP